MRSGLMHLLLMFAAVSLVTYTGKVTVSSAPPATPGTRALAAPTALPLTSAAAAAASCSAAASSARASRCRAAAVAVTTPAALAAASAPAAACRAGWACVLELSHGVKRGGAAADDASPRLDPLHACTRRCVRTRSKVLKASSVFFRPTSVVMNASAACLQSASRASSSLNHSILVVKAVV